MKIYTILFGAFIALRVRGQECPITYKYVLQAIQNELEKNNCKSFIQIFDECLTETINTVKNRQGKPFEPYILPQEDQVQNVQFLLNNEFEYLTAESNQVFFNCVLRKQSLFIDDEPIPNPVPNPVPSPSPTPPEPVPDPEPNNPYQPENTNTTPILRNTVKSEKCNNYDEIFINNVVYVNNQWGIDKTFEPPEQCLISGEDKKGQKYYGWEWKYTGCDFTVFAYPEVIYGNKPWSNMASTDRGFEAKIKDYKTLKVHLETESFDLSGTYNLAVELWTTDQKKTTQQSIPQNIKTELMWILYITEPARPAGNKIDEIEVDGINWNLNLFSRQENVFWDFYTLSSQYTICETTEDNTAKSCKFTIDIKKFLDILVPRGFANPEEYISVIEIGNEIIGSPVACGGYDSASIYGTGKTFIKKLDVEYDI